MAPEDCSHGVSFDKECPQCQLVWHEECASGLRMRLYEHEIAIRQIKQEMGGADDGATLNPCPCCGGAAEVQKSGVLHVVACKTCGLQSAHYAANLRDEAVKRWNQRK